MNTWRQRIRPEQIRELSLIGLIVIALLIFGWQIENFLSARTFNRITSSVAIVGMVAIGQTLVVLTRNIDLSVGSIVGFTAYFVGSQLAANPDMPPVMAVVLAVLTGGALGLVNGLIVAYGRVPAIITTLGTLAIYRMLLINYANARTITVDSLPPWVVELSRQTLVTIGEFAVRPLMLFTVGAVVIFQLILGYTVFGRRLYAIGSNPEAARFAGLPAQRTVLAAFVLCGMLAGMAGFLFLARFGNITAVAGQGIELESVAAVVVGGVNTFGGSGTVFGALLGAFLIDLLGQGLLRWLGISEFWRDALLGLLILLAVASDSVILGWLRRLWAAPALPMEAGNER
ncbi:MAG: monosaccharide-transporting ATPase [Pirellulaceae bacterium]|uniref:ABC transporter permease n=1 Tax=Chloroflexus sp. TaxID=1904827 RepID=UPI0021DD7AC3|nr:ABC transporter permease [Chloroflexus sp.]GIV87502.1 MAG: monosaccharide-transporting ATPase [Chloroflexus sp.]GIW91188.1 MAG: monosaccharide-transporting ATPase [Pirellulaceae bacterium]